jgi:hypothetical protein
MMRKWWRLNGKEASLKRSSGPVNVDAAILSVAQFVQPCQSDALATEAKKSLHQVRFTKQQMTSRINALVKGGYLWSRSDGLLILTPAGHELSKASLPPKERDKFRLLILNSMRYK